MNTRSNRRSVSITSAMAAVSCIVTVTVGSSGIAHASITSEPRGSGVAVATTTYFGSYGEPLTALGGQSLALYVADHWESVIAAGL
jgi:hypothetical protein